MIDNRYDSRYYNEDPRNTHEEDAKKVVLVKESKDFRNSIIYERFKNAMTRHYNEVKFTIIGLIIAFLFLSIGFFGTLLVIILAIIGNIYGKFRDGDLKTLYMLERIFRRF